jgi:UDP-N-acetylmuramyl pentapeptide phosphotransferase/UDP-N-acetylglucosamine-1-phosphate transferase
MDDLRFPLVAPLAAGATSLALLPLLIRSRLLPQDRPNERSLHAAPVPRSGGMAIVPPVLVAGWLGAPELRLALGCAAALALLSFADDLRPIPPALRLIAHLGVAATLVVAGFSHWPVALAVIAILAVVWMTNLYNFMDGSDGLAGGMAVAGFGCYAVVAAAAGNTVLTLVCTSIAACSLAFLVFNFHPARIFMGDIGSIPLGFLAAALGVMGWDQGLWPVYLPPLVFSPFIVDASLTLARRLARGEKVWLAHREHYYQRLIRTGVGHRNTALAEYALMAAAGGCAIAMVRLTEGTQLLLLAAWALVYGALAVSIDRRWARYGASSR